MERIEFPVILKKSNEVLTLLLDKESAARATKDEQFLRNLVKRYKENAAGQDNVHSAAETNGESKSKGFTWPDEAVLLLMETYREKEYEFNNSLKKHNVIWKEIAAELQRSNYKVSGLQCSVKFAGLRRTYKNIHRQNEKRDKSHSSWAFYSAMDSLIGEKAHMHCPAIASSEGPAPPTPTTSSSSSPMRVSEDLQSAPKKRRIETILEKYITDIKHERESIKQQRDKERRIAEKKREARYIERKIEREKMHKDNMEIQKSLLAVLQTLANKK